MGYTLTIQGMPERQTRSDISFHMDSKMRGLGVYCEPALEIIAIDGLDTYAETGTINAYNFKGCPGFLEKLKTVIGLFKSQFYQFSEPVKDVSNMHGCEVWRFKLLENPTNHLDQFTLSINQASGHDLFRFLGYQPESGEIEMFLGVPIAQFNVCELSACELEHAAVVGDFPEHQKRGFLNLVKHAKELEQPISVS